MKKYKEFMKERSFARGSLFIVFNVFLVYVLYFMLKNFDIIAGLSLIHIYLDFAFLVLSFFHLHYSVFKVQSFLELLALVENKGFEPLTPCVQGRCSPS